MIEGQKVFPQAGALKPVAAGISAGGDQAADLEMGGMSFFFELLGPDMAVDGTIPQAFFAGFSGFLQRCNMQSKTVGCIGYDLRTPGSGNDFFLINGSLAPTRSIPEPGVRQDGECRSFE